MDCKTIINIEDYDVYYFAISISSFKAPFINAHINQYVLSELEKVHPFFGSHCAVFWKIIMINMKLTLMVVVMDAIILHEYKGLKAKTNLYICNKEKKIPKMKVFKSNKKFSFLFFLGFFCALSFIASTGYYIAVSSEKNQTSEYQEMGDIKSNQNANMVMKIFFSKLEQWLSEGMLCTSFSYTQQKILSGDNEFQVHIETTVEGVYPEEVYHVSMDEYDNASIQSYNNAVSISPVNFVNNIPQLTLTLNDVFTASSSLSIDKNTQNTGSMREIIVAHGGIIREEYWDTNSSFFDIPIQNWTSLFTAMIDLFYKNHQTIEKLFMTYDKSTLLINVQIYIRLGTFPDELLFLERIFNAQTKSDSTFRAQQTLQFENKKIGNIKKNDGSEVVFYLSNDGKIIAKEVP